LTRVRWGQFFVARVWSGRDSHLWFGLGLGKFPLKASNFSTFSPSGQKNLFASGQKGPWSKAGPSASWNETKNAVRLGVAMAGHGTWLGI